MDNFMDKLMNRFNAADMIKANNQAERDMMNIKSDEDAFFNGNNEEVISELRKMSARNEQLAASIRSTNEKHAALVEALRGVAEKNSAVMQAINATNEKSAIVMEALAETERKNNIIIDAINATNSNNADVLAAINGIATQMTQNEDGSDEIANVFTIMQQDVSASTKNAQKLVSDVATVYAGINKLQNKLTETQEKMDSVVTETQDFMHKESVKVYRNVQAMIEEENEKLLASIDEKIKAKRKPVTSKWVMFFLIMLFLICGIDLVVNLNYIFNFLPIIFLYK